MTVFGMITVGIVAGLMILMGAVLSRGKGAFLIAGYNFMSEEEKAQYDEVALCKFVGKVSLLIGLFTMAFLLASIPSLEKTWIISFIGIIITSIYAVYYANTNNRFKVNCEGRHTGLPLQAGDVESPQTVDK